MKVDFLVLLPLNGYWHCALCDATGIVDLVGFVSAPATTESSPALAAAAKQVCAELEVDCRDVAVAVPSNWCLVMSLAKAKVPFIRSSFWRRSRYDLEAAAYQFEEWLPWPAEESAIAFVESSETLLAVGVRRTLLSSVASELNEVAFRTELILPLSLAVAQWRYRSCNGLAATVIVDDGALVDVIVADPVTQVVAAWTRCTPASPELRAAQVSLGRKPAADMGNVQTAAPDGEHSRETPLLTVSGSDIVSDACAMVGDICALRAQPWCRFSAEPPTGKRPAAPVPRKIRAWQRLAFASAALLFLSTACFFGQRWRSASDEVRRQQTIQVSMYRALYPDTAIPEDVESRLRAELGQSQAIEKRKSDNGGTAHIEALDTLAGAFTAIPTELRFRVDEIRIDSNGILVEGISNSRADAERLASTMRRGLAALVDIEPPRTEASPDNAVSFTIIGLRTAGSK